MEIDDEKIRRGLTNFLVKQGGTVRIDELHSRSQFKYGAGHQDFSRIMESLVGEERVAFAEGEFSVTDKGRAWIDELKAAKKAREAAEREG